MVVNFQVGETRVLRSFHKCPSLNVLAEAFDSEACFLVCTERANGAHIGKRISPKRHWFLGDPDTIAFPEDEHEFRL